MPPSIVILIRGLRLYHKCNNKHILCNKRFKAFLQSQKSKEKPAPLLAIKKPTLLMRRLLLHIFIILCTIYVLYKCNYNSLV